MEIIDRECFEGMIAEKDAEIVWLNLMIELHVENAKKIAADAAAEIERLRALLGRAVTHLEDGQAHDEGAFDDSCDTCVLLQDLRAALGPTDQQSQPTEKSL